MADETENAEAGAWAPADVFISYKRLDRERCELIAAKLLSIGVRVWFDARLDAGSTFDEEINREVRAAKAVLVLWSRESVGSDWVRAEASIGRGRNVLVAAFLEACEPYPPFNLVHTEDLTGFTGDDVHPGWRRTLESIGPKIGRPGLAQLAAARVSGDAKRLRAWAESYPNDPFADSVWAQVEEMEVEETRKRAREGREKAAAEAAAREKAAAEAAEAARRAEEARAAQRARQTQSASLREDPMGAVYVPSAEEKAARTRLIAIIAAAVVGVVGIGWFALSRGGDEPPAAVEAAVDPAVAADEAAWKQAIAAPTRDSLLGYINSNPDGRFVEEARARLSSLSSQSDAGLWEEVRGSTKSADVRRYVQEHPYGRHIDEARTLLTRLERQEDETAWRRALAAPVSSDSDPVENFLRANPNSAFADEARRLLTPSVPSSRPSCEAQPATEFAVYFEWDRANVLSIAGETISAALQRVGNAAGIRRVLLLAHDDSDGSARSSVAISERRAAAVRDALVARGVPANVIRSYAYGESNPPRPTADGVREPLNRVVMVVIC